MKKFMVLFCLLVSSSNAALLDLKADQSEVEFLAVGKPSFLKIKGVTKALSAELDINEQKLISGTLDVDLNQIETGIELRDEHMKDNYLKTREFPKAILTMKDLPLDFEGEFLAELTLHGHTQSVKIEISKEDLKRQASFKINIQDFNIPVPSYQGITVAKEVTVTTKLEFVQP